MSNAAAPIISLINLSMSYLIASIEHENCKDSLGWVVKRGIRQESLKIGESRWLVTSGSLFEHRISSLRSN